MLRDCVTKTAMGTLSPNSGLTLAVADRASPWWYGAALLAIALVCEGVLPVRPAAKPGRYA